MFIAHGEKFRKHARWIMAGVLLLIIPSFVALFTTTSASNRRLPSDLPTIGGKPVDANEFQEARNAITAVYIISSGRAPQRTSEMEDRLTQEAVVRMVMLRKAKELSIRIADVELVQAIRNQPMLLNEAGQFDPDRYRRFTIYLNNLGISETHYEQLMREELTRAKLEQLIAAPATATPAEVDSVFTPLHERVTVEMAHFNAADYTQPITVSNEEAQAFYDQNKESFRTPALVKVRYTHFSTTDAEKTIKLSDDEVAEYFERNKPKYAGTNSVPPTLAAVKSEAHKDLLTLRADRAAADRATDFSVRLVPKPGGARPSFSAISTEFGVVSKETEFFGMYDNPVGSTSNVAFSQQAFALSPDSPTSDPVAGEDGYDVLEYVDSKPSIVPTFDEVKDKVIDQLQRVHKYDATVRQARVTVDELKKLIASGKSFADACAELKIQFETPPAFSLTDEQLKLPSAQRVQQETVGMPVGAVSEFIPTISGGLVFHLKSRQPPDPAVVENDKAKWAQRVLQQNRQALFQAWVSTLIRDQGVTFGRQRSRPAPEQPESEPAPGKS